MLPIKCWNMRLESDGHAAKSPVSIHGVRFISLFCLDFSTTIDDDDVCYCWSFIFRKQIVIGIVPFFSIFFSLHFLLVSVEYWHVLAQFRYVWLNCGTFEPTSPIFVSNLHQLLPFTTNNNNHNHNFIDNNLNSYRRGQLVNIVRWYPACDWRWIRCRYLYGQLICTYVGHDWRSTWTTAGLKQFRALC